ncbi:TraM recognition domain-containing protein [Tsukamurella spumae]|uniref:TraM recognition domain-containing protein n=1 Tax=Tsukamurella spumae TaxID=44753 RepID=A0A846X727_9ACTN|nr:TraM recognition domain-containing protein [Tsukamurella spumae]NKY20871.1 TraM recognition domain-containing protein [Tsukamurella spumae]
MIELCLEKRVAFGGHGRTYVLDLGGQVPDGVLPDGVERVVPDPVALITCDDDAIDMASLLMKAGSAGASGLATGASSPEGAMWETQSTPPMAGILRAAGADGVRWARAAMGRVNPPESDPDAPSWVAATRRLEAMGSDILADELVQASLLPEKMLSSVMITMKQGVAPWIRSTIAGEPGTKVFTPALLEHPRATLFMVAPASGVAAGAAVACVDAIGEHWRRAQTAPEPVPHLLMCVDELCNTMPWARLPTVVTEARGMGIAVLAAMQGTSQFARRYGSDGMTELRDTWPAILCLTGAPEKEILEKAAWAHGRTESVKMSRDHEGKRSASTEVGDMLHGSDLLPHDIDHGRLLRGSRPADASSPKVREAGLLVELPDISTLKFRTRVKAS